MYKLDQVPLCPGVFIMKPPYFAVALNRNNFDRTFGFSLMTSRMISFCFLFLVGGAAGKWTAFLNYYDS